MISSVGPTEVNPEFTYELIGLSNDDQFSDINVTVQILLLMEICPTRLLCGFMKLNPGTIFDQIFLYPAKWYSYCF